MSKGLIYLIKRDWNVYSCSGYVAYNGYRYKNRGGDGKIRNGRFALWSNKEFELVSFQQQYYLQSEDPLDFKNGFTEKNGNRSVYIKTVFVGELEDAYEIIPYVMIAGYRFSVEGCNEKTVEIALVTSNPFVKEKIGVRSYGKFEYIIELPLKDSVIEEDRVPILGFEGLYT